MCTCFFFLDVFLWAGGIHQVVRTASLNIIFCQKSACLRSFITSLMVTTQVLNGCSDIESTKTTHKHTRWAVLLSGRPCNVILIVISLAVICYGTCHFGQEPGLIGQLLRGGGLDAQHPRSIRQLLLGLGVSHSGTMSACYFGAFSSVSVLRNNEPS